MYISTKNKRFIILVIGLGTMISFIVSCAESKMVSAKSGAQLWAENCQRCHNTPSPTTFSTEQWKTLGLHMQSRALLTQNERNKIFEFLGKSN